MKVLYEATYIKYFWACVFCMAENANVSLYIPYMIDTSVVRNIHKRILKIVSCNTGRCFTSQNYGIPLKFRQHCYWRCFDFKSCNIELSLQKPTGPTAIPKTVTIDIQEMKME